MSADDQTCPSCGARVPAGADRCDLCGTPVEASDESPDTPSDESAEPDQPPATDENQASGADEEGGDAPPVFCNQCGWENPSGAQYCSRCGEPLQDLSDASPAGTRRVMGDLPSSPADDDEEDTSSSSAEESEEEEVDEQVAIGKQIAFVLGGALAVVLGLFFVTQWSNQYEWGDGSSSPPQSAQAGAGGSGPSASRSSDGQRPMGGSGPNSQQSSPTDLQALLDQTADSLTGPVAEKIDSLRTRIDQASGGEQRKLKAKLVNLYIGAGHPDRAAVVQKELASATGRVDAQRRAADLLYRWMQKLERQGQREQVFQVARHAAQAYETVSEQRPEDLDARTRMGEAYLLTNKPMRGIKTINAVLDDDSTFVPARFQKGLALLQINRLDQAQNQFERVKQYAESDAPFYQQAERALKVIEKRQSSAPAGGE